MVSSIMCSNMSHAGGEEEVAILAQGIQDLELKMATSFFFLRSLGPVSSFVTQQQALFRDVGSLRHWTRGSKDAGWL